MNNKNSKLADRLFHHSRSTARAEAELVDIIEKIVGGGEWWEDLTWDDYDSSFELHKVKIGQRFTTNHLIEFANLGFRRCWLNYIDGSERGYTCSPPSEGKLRHRKPSECRSEAHERLNAQIRHASGNCKFPSQLEIGDFFSYTGSFKVYQVLTKPEVDKEFESDYTCIFCHQDARHETRLIFDITDGKRTMGIRLRSGEICSVHNSFNDGDL